MGESGRADKTLYEAFPKQADESVLVQSKSLEASDPRFEAAVADVSRRVDRVAYVEARGQARHLEGRPLGARAVRDPRRRRDRPRTASTRCMDAVDGRAAARTRSCRVEQFGDASADKAIDESRSRRTSRRPRSLSLPVTLLILLFAFGALVAAASRCCWRISAVAATLGLLALVEPVAPGRRAVASVDPADRPGGRASTTRCSTCAASARSGPPGAAEHAALEAAAATSGRAVLVSGLTVMVAMAGMFLAGDEHVHRRSASGTILVVAVAMIGSLTVLPAMLSKLGDRVEKGRVPVHAAGAARDGESRVWAAVVDRVLRRPCARRSVAGGAADRAGRAGARHGHRGLPGIDTLPRDLPVMQTYDRIQDAFPGESLAGASWSSRPTTSPRRRSARRSTTLRREAVDDRSMLRPGAPSTSAATARSPSVDAPDRRRRHRRRVRRARSTTLRDELVPATVGQRRRAPSANVTGMTAGTSDFNDAMTARTAAARVRVRAVGWRSCCCWSRSARS